MTRSKMRRAKIRSYWMEEVKAPSGISNTVLANLVAVHLGEERGRHDDRTYLKRRYNEVQNKLHSLRTRTNKLLLSTSEGISVRSVDFLRTREWRELRYKVLLRYSSKCQCCGKAPPLTIIHVDHIKPRHTHPELALDINNLQVLCEDCNIGKGAWDSTDWR